MKNSDLLERRQATNTLFKEVLPDSESRELFAGPSARVEFFESLSWNNFRDVLTHINGRLREIEPRVHTHDGEKSILPMATVADSRDKTQVLNECFDLMVDYLDKSEDEPEEKLTRLALAVGSAIIHVHPFADGNGRTARFMESFLMRGTSDIEALESHTADAASWQLTTKTFCIIPPSSDKQIDLPLYDILTGSREGSKLVDNINLANEANRMRLARLLDNRVADQVITAALDRHIDWSLVDGTDQDIWGIKFDKVAPQVDDALVDTLENLIREYKNSVPIATVEMCLSDSDQAKAFRAETIKNQTEQIEKLQARAQVT